MNDSKSKYREFYEEKLQTEYEEIEKVRSAKDELVTELNQAYADYDSLKAEHEAAQEKFSSAQAQLDEKFAVIEFVEVEI